MAEADRFAESVSRATYGRETRVPIVSAIEHWLGSAERLTNLIRKMIEINPVTPEEKEAWLRELSFLGSMYPKRVVAFSVTPTGTTDYYTLVVTRKNGS